MPQVFTIRWPLFARLDAVFLFPLAFLLAGQNGIVASIVNPSLAPALAGFALRYGIAPMTGVWAAWAIVTFLPYLVLMVVIDRVLTVRKGFAILSLLAILCWAKAGLISSDWVASMVPTSFTAPGDGPSFPMTVALAAGAFALLMHIRPLVLGILDDGRVAERLVALSGDNPDLVWSERTNRAPQRGPAYGDRQDVRIWLAGESEFNFRGPRRSPVTTVLYAVTWSAVVGSVFFAWTIWNSRDQDQASAGQIPAPRAMARNDAPPARVRQPVDIPPQRAANIGMPTRNIRPASPISVPAQTPAVQRPGSPLPAVVGPSGNAASANEAVAERARDGGFVFSGEINGVNASMVFDTGASVVGLRAEDAIRMGYVLDRLNFSAKVKTANGTADVAPVIIDTITIGNITQRNVVGFVARPGMLHENLLGQTFLARLAGFGVEGNRLVLKGR